LHLVFLPDLTNYSTVEALFSAVNNILFGYLKWYYTQHYITVADFEAIFGDSPTIDQMGQPRTHFYVRPEIIQPTAMYPKPLELRLHYQLETANQANGYPLKNRIFFGYTSSTDAMVTAQEHDNRSDPNYWNITSPQNDLWPAWLSGGAFGPGTIQSMLYNPASTNYQSSHLFGTAMNSFTDLLGSVTHPHANLVNPVQGLNLDNRFF
jgi:hypothetical protein